MNQLRLGTAAMLVALACVGGVAAHEGGLLDRDVVLPPSNSSSLRLLGQAGCGAGGWLAGNNCSAGTPTVFLLPAAAGVRTTWSLAGASGPAPNLSNRPATLTLSARSGCPAAAALGATLSCATPLPLLANESAWTLEPSGLAALPGTFLLKSRAVPGCEARYLGVLCGDPTLRLLPDTHDAHGDTNEAVALLIWQVGSLTQSLAQRPSQLPPRPARRPVVPVRRPCRGSRF